MGRLTDPKLRGFWTRACSFGVVLASPCIISCPKIQIANTEPQSLLCITRPRRLTCRNTSEDGGLFRSDVPKPPPEQCAVRAHCRPLWRQPCSIQHGLRFPCCSFNFEKPPYCRNTGRSYYHRGEEARRALADWASQMCDLATVGTCRDSYLPHIAPHLPCIVSSALL